MSQYTDLITSEHQQPNFLNIVDDLTVPFADIEKSVIDLNINTATNYMLDIIGAWVGQSRRLTVPLQLTNALYDDIIYGGWDTGVYFNEYDAKTIISVLDDEDYRFILKMKITQNGGDGRIITAYNILNNVGINAYIFDAQRMIVYILIIKSLTVIQKALISQGIVNITPFGVLVQYQQVNNTAAVYDQPISTDFGGWDVGEYATFL